MRTREKSSPRRSAHLAPRAASPRIRLRVDLAAGCSVGPGKIDLLESIARDGSLSLAARNLGMSYRRAWLLMDDLNRSFATPLAILAAGGTFGGGARVTDMGHALIEAYRALERATTALATRRLRDFAVNETTARPRRVTARLRRTVRTRR